MVGALDFVVDGGYDWSGVRGLTLASGQLFFADAGGNLRRMDFRDGRPRPSRTAVVDGPDRRGGTRWEARGLFARAARG